MSSSTRRNSGRRLGVFPVQNPGLFTIPLSFITGIVVSLLAPEPAAQTGFARLEHQIHVGEEEPV
jgi:cation/acetate symporter